MEEVFNYYNSYDEEGRLERDNVHKLEYFTTIHYLDKLINGGAKVLDACAGTGKYSFYLDSKGHDVTAVDIVPRFVDIMKTKTIKSGSQLKIHLGDARDLSLFEQNSFDAVLCMGALYHLKEVQDRRRVIEECLRVLKEKGILVVAYVNRYAMHNIELMRKEESLNKGILEDILSRGINCDEKLDTFYFASPKEIEELMSEFSIERLHNVGTNGIGYLLADRINNLNEDDYKYWLDYHLKTCENENMIGYSLHGLYIGRKR